MTIFTLAHLYFEKKQCLDLGFGERSLCPSRIYICGRLDLSSEAQRDNQGARSNSPRSAGQPGPSGHSELYLENRVFSRADGLDTRGSGGAAEVRLNVHSFHPTSNPRTTSQNVAHAPRILNLDPAASCMGKMPKTEELMVIAREAPIR